MGEHIEDRSAFPAILWPVLRGPLIAALGIAAIIFVAVVYAPAQWISWVSWQLYLDRLGPMFSPPSGWTGRVMLGGILAATGLIVTLFVALAPALRKPLRVVRYASVHAAPAVVADHGEDVLPHNGVISDDLVPDVTTRLTEPLLSEALWDQAQDVPARNKLDHHPDDAPRAPISAIRDLPAGGLGPAAHALDAPDAPQNPARGENILILADLAPDGRIAAGEEPWLQAVEASGPARPDRSDISLSAMVARLEAGFRRRSPSAPVDRMAVPVPGGDIAPPRTVADHHVDLALEAALGTLHRMNLRAVG